MTKMTRTMIAAAAVSGILTGISVKTANAGVLASAVMAEEKMKCSSKDGCPSKKETADKDKKEKASCSSKEGCPSKKDKEKASCSSKEGCPSKKDKEKASCSGKDGCPAKKETK